MQKEKRSGGQSPHTPIHMRYSTHKDSDFSTQYQRVRHSFSERPKTMLMVAHDTGIERANICRYVARMEKQNDLKRLKRGICEVSECGAVYFFREKGASHER